MRVTQWVRLASNPRPLSQVKRRPKKSKTHSWLWGGGPRGPELSVGLSASESWEKPKFGFLPRETRNTEVPLLRKVRGTPLPLGKATLFLKQLTWLLREP